jgi:hypothetical protein
VAIPTVQISFRTRGFATSRPARDSPRSSVTGPDGVGVEDGDGDGDDDGLGEGLAVGSEVVVGLAVAVPGRSRPRQPARPSAVVQPVARRASERRRFTPDDGVGPGVTSSSP